MENKLSQIVIKLNNGEEYGCTSIHVTRAPKNNEPSLLFISSGVQDEVHIEDVEEIKLSSETWCPHCQ
jgi:hypothetical protein